ncbi:hypothetical protein [Leminorella grimontii]|uniref:hypothetical protein n=1 Tax=Leminorella grimontii TaxID=82981 RepID=UPI000409B35E|nr:hypothetical protein [Leminorella grimontii]KFC97768.1 hypothetical protein GLGR_0182 [Leminorella grimontii ATCC 33999 = DSM 5078]VFS56343.1 Uncharacterised protein [Leminorella grimontii]
MNLFMIFVLLASAIAVLYVWKTAKTPRARLYRLALVFLYLILLATVTHHAALYSSATG